MPERKCYAYAPGDDESKWEHLLCGDDGEWDSGKIEAVAHLIGKKDRGGVGERDLATVKSRVRAAWKKANPSRADDAMPTAIKASDPYDFCYDDECVSSMPMEKMGKTDTRVDYREATSGAQMSMETVACGNCRFYGWGTCALVEGTVEANYVCDLFTKTPVLYPMNMADAASKSGSWALFTEQKFVDAPDWINYWPKPGRFNHPEYGDMVITKDRNEQIVNNFHTSGYQKMLPVDVDHDLEWSGAVGWIDDMRMADDGSVEAHVDWTENGLRLIEEDRFRYFSPSVLKQWKHIVTGKAIADVPAGGAICTHPYFKDEWLRPLVATETDLIMWKMSDKDEPVRAVVTKVPEGREKEVPVTEKTPAALQFTEDEVTQFRAILAAGGPQKFAEQQTKIDELQTKVNESAQRERRQRFTEVVRGRDGENDGAPWLGEIEHNVTMLMHLADTAGEQSDIYKSHVAAKKAEAERALSSTLFSEIGSLPEDLGATRNATEAIEKLVQRFMSEDTSAVPLDEKRQRAMSRAAREHRQTYNEYRREASRLGMTGQ